MEGSSSKNKWKQLFVLIHESKKNDKKGLTRCQPDALLAEIESSVTEMKETLKSDPSRELLYFLRSESEQRKKREKMQTLQAMATPPQQRHWAF